MTKRIRAFLAAGLLAATLALPLGAAAHNGDCGALGFQMLSINYWVTDSVAGYTSDGRRIIFHNYGGIWAPSDYYSIC